MVLARGATINPKVPTNLRILRGNPGKRRFNTREPMPPLPSVCPEPPEYLSVVAAEEWRRIAPQAYVLGLLTNLDISLMAVYCEAYARWRAAVAALAEAAENDPETHGLVLEDDAGNPVANPLVRMVSQASRDLLRFAMEFGLTPVARSRIDSGGLLPGELTKFGDLLA